MKNLGKLLHCSPVFICGAKKCIYRRCNHWDIRATVCNHASAVGKLLLYILQDDITLFLSPLCLVFLAFKPAVSEAPWMLNTLRSLPLKCIKTSWKQDWIFNRCHRCFMESGHELSLSTRTTSSNTLFVTLNVSSRCCQCCSAMKWVSTALILNPSVFSPLNTKGVLLHYFAV